MKQKTAGFFIAISILTVATLVVLIGRSFAKEKITAINALPQTVLTQTASPRVRNFYRTRRWFGTVRASDKIQIKAMVPGKIISISARDEMPVAKGDLLFTIGGPIFENRMEILKNQTDTLEERIHIAEKLVKIKQEATNLKLAKYEELAAAKDAWARLKTELRASEQKIRQLREAGSVHAGINGVFTNRQVSVGQEVQPGDDLAGVVSQNHIYIEATLFPKGSIDELIKEQAIIHLAEGKTLQGNITTVLPQKTAEGASVVWIQGPDLASSLCSGQTVTGTIVLSVHENALAIPQNAVVRDEQERPYVFLQDSTGLRKKIVETGIVSDGWVEVVSGLTKQDMVVVQGAYELFYRDFKKIYKVAD